ncbi:hypothetical protein ACET3X_004709 [Alternaria dauci]|uniref:Uncharacterized protein n=1 Tax=Alternaria dauci TaxID=48095 RepID=A0ABR3UJY7_9PLEO
MRIISLLPFIVSFVTLTDKVFGQHSGMLGIRQALVCQGDGENGRPLTCSTNNRRTTDCADCRRLEGANTQCICPTTDCCCCG